MRCNNGRVSQLILPLEISYPKTRLTLLVGQPTRTTLILTGTACSTGWNCSLRHGTFLQTCGRSIHWLRETVTLTVTKTDSLTVKNLLSQWNNLTTVLTTQAMHHSCTSTVIINNQQKKHNECSTFSSPRKRVENACSMISMLGSKENRQMPSSKSFLE